MNNLPLVEEKLRQRGMDPAAVLKDFREVDTRRRQAITEAETSKAQRNRASEEIAKLKKSGQDASAAMAQTKELREQIQELEKTACRSGRAAARNSRGHSQPAARERAGRAQRGATTWKSGAGERRRNLISLPSRTGNWAQQLGHPRSGTRRQADRGALCGLLGFGREAGAGADEFHARPAYARAWIYRGAAAIPGEFRFDVRHGPVAEVCGGSFRVPHGERISG